MPALKKIGAAALAAFGWTTGGGVTTVNASYLQVAGGGGGGGSYYAGGGGAGGYLTGTTSLTTTLSYTVVVGAGGSGGTSSPSASQGTNGSNSQFGSLTASVGGGGGGTQSATVNGLSGGSGGGGGSSAGATGGSATSGQGNAGGGSSFSAPYSGGGGGGASAAGTSGPSAGNGGNGTASSITGSSVTYAGGGGGGGNAAFGTGGSGGGGTGSTTTASPTGGTANTGGGGGGGGFPPGAGGNGGSGIVIISYAGAQQFGGGVVTSVGGNTIHTFLTSGTLSPLSSLSASYLIVAGGGGGGGGIYHGGGGGAGGMLTGSGVTIDTSSTYLVTVGAGGAGGVSYAKGVNGSNSSIGIVATASVGGGGGGVSNSGLNGISPSSGGSGGGAYGVSNAGATLPVAGAAGTSGQGNSGGTTGYYVLNSQYGASGGGGAGAVGGSESSGGVAGNGGAGLTSSISGTSTYYAGGGGGSCYTGIAGGSPGTGGVGGGGNGGSDVANATSGTANTGGGGGGMERYSSATGGSGGSGIVIISYAGATQQMAGGSVTITGGNVIHTFTSSGYLTPLTYYSNSLRFRSSASAYLNRTFNTPTSQNTWTISAWLKRGGLSGASALSYDFGPSPTGGNYQIFFNSGDNLAFFNNPSYVFITSAVYRDPAAWYHVVLAVSSGASGTNKVRLYVNGSEVTAFGTDNRSSFSSSPVNSAVAHYLGQASSAGNYFDGYMTNYNFIDGQQLTPNSFGTFNSYGVWQPINYGGSYGTNGFYLPFNSGSQTYAASFSGSGQYLTLASNTAFNIFGGDMTVECWFNANSLANSPHLFAFVQDATNRESIYFSSSTLTFYSSSSAGSGNRISTAALSTGLWYHYALVKSGATFTAYLNGIAIGTSTTTQYSTANQSLQIGTYNSGGYAGDNFNGYISNVRVVKGTAVYTANFTPSTTPLTAITNTQLLTLQNATIIDNSTNAFTITNTGSVTTATGKPLSTAVFQDQSPQGNNWTPNNISGATGSTLDYMTDVPTLTSATAANYCVLNPLQSYASSLSNGNLQMSNASATWIASLASFGISTGKWYWEITSPNLGGSAYSIVGVSDSTFPAFTASATNYLGYTAGSYGYFNNTGNKYNNNVSTAYGATWTANDVIGVALDMNAGTLIFYKNGSSQGTAYSGLTGTLFPAISGYSSNTTVNFGQQPFVYTPPTGYVALNTYNL